MFLLQQKKVFSNNCENCKDQNKYIFRKAENFRLSHRSLFCKSYNLLSTEQIYTLWMYNKKLSAYISLIYSSNWQCGQNVANVFSDFIPQRYCGMKVRQVMKESREYRVIRFSLILYILSQRKQSHILSRVIQSLFTLNGCSCRHLTGMSKSYQALL